MEHTKQDSRMVNDQHSRFFFSTKGSKRKTATNEKRSRHEESRHEERAHEADTKKEHTRHKKETAQ